MSTYFLKGTQNKFVFSALDIEHYINELLKEQWVLFEDWVDEKNEMIPLSTAQQIKEIMNKEKYLKYNDVPMFVVVPEEFQDQMIWETIHLNSGGLRYNIQRVLSHTVDLQFSRHNGKRITTGRISVCSEWEDENLTRHPATYELDVYKKMKNMLRRLSVGKIGGILVGFDAYDQCGKGIRQLSYDLNNPDFYTFEQITLIKKKR